MKKNVCRVVLAVAMMVLGLGAGNKKADAQMTTRVTIEEDGSGSRVMEAVLPKENRKQYLKGKNAGKFEKLLKKECPKEFDYKMEDYKGGYKLTLTLSFDSIEDYKEKVNKIYKSSYTEPDVTLKVAEGPFESGMEYEETFDSENLMQWFDDALSKADFIWWWNVSTMIDEDTQTLVYAGEEYENENGWSDSIQVSNFEECYLSTIYIYNNSVNAAKIDRTVVFAADKDKELSTELKEYIEAGLPEGATGEWNSDSDYYTYYIVELGELEIDKLEAAMNSLLQTEKCSIAVSSADYGTETFTVGYTVEETTDIEAFQVIADDDGTKGPILSYGYAAGLDISDDGYAKYSDSSEQQPAASYSFYSDEFNDYFKSQDTVTSFSSTVAMSLLPDALEIRTELSKDEEDLTRSISFIYDEVPDSAALEGICKKFEDDDSNIKAEVSKEGVTLKVTGDDSDLEDFMETVFGYETGDIKYSVDDSLFGAKKEFEYKEETSIYGMVEDDERIKSVVILPSGAKLEKDSRYEKYETDERTYEMDAESGTCKWRLEGQITTVLAIILLVAVVVVICVIVLVIVIIVAKKRRR